MGQQKPLPEKTSIPSKISAAQHGGHHCTAVDVQPTPAAKLVSLPSFSSSASTLDQLLSLSPSSTEAHATTFCASWHGHGNQHQHLCADAFNTMGHRMPTALEPSRGPDQHQYLCADALNTMGHRLPNALEPSRGTDQLALSAPPEFASSHQKQPCSDPHSGLGSTSVWSDFPSDMEDLLDWAAAGIDLGPPTSLPANTHLHPSGSSINGEGLQCVMPTTSSDQISTSQYATTMDEVPGLACSDGWASNGLVDVQTHADMDTLPALHDMYAALEQPSLHSCQAHDETASLHIMHGVAQQDTLSALSSDCAAQLPSPLACEQISACQNQVAEAQPSGLLLQTCVHKMSHAGPTAASMLFSDMPETEVGAAENKAAPLFSDMPGVEVDALLAASSMSCELNALLASTSACSTAQSDPSWLQLDPCSAAHSSTEEHSMAQIEASWLQHKEITQPSTTQHGIAHHSTAQLLKAQNGAARLKLDRTAFSAQERQAGYSSGSGCSGGDGSAAVDQEAAARKRRGGRPRVYDLDQPIISGNVPIDLPTQG